jgi:hypothetical protein
MAIRRIASAALALAAGSIIVCLTIPAGAASKSTPAPQYIVQFSATELPPSTSGVATFHSTSCAIGPATNPIVVQCHETGTIRFTASGGSGTATVTSVMSDINWKFKLHRSSVSSMAYRMVGKGTETSGASPIVRPVKVTGTIAVSPTPEPTLQGTEDIFPLANPVT